MTPHAWVETDLAVLGANLEAIRGRLQRPAQLLLVVKADAYGHGMAAVARQAFRSGVRWFVVARTEEAVALRSAMPEGEILVLGAVWPGEVPELVARRITPALVGESQARALAAESRRRGVTLRCHAKVDTGMGRLGFAWEEAAAALARLVREGGLRVEGLCTHFASGGRAGPGSFAEEQARRFRAVAEQCAARGLAIPFRHIANSAAFLARPDWDLDGVRLGIVAYGYGNRQDRRAVRTRPFLQWKTRVVQVRRVPAGSPVGYSSTHVTPAATQLAVIDVGYSDGYARLLSNKGCVLVGGRRAPVVGRVTMNFTTVDVGPDATVRDGDEAVLIGTQGGASVWADELARQAQTIPYEILTGIRSRPLEAG